MSAAAWELQKAIVSRLSADAALAAAQGLTGAAVFDFVEERKPLPYTEIEQVNAQEWDAGSNDDGVEYGQEFRIAVYNWSAYEGKKQAHLMNDAVMKSLRDQEGALVLTGHRVVNVRYLFHDVLRDGDLQAYYGVVQFRVITEEV